MSRCRPPATLEPCRGSLHEEPVQQPVEVFRSARRRACEERAFVLTAVGIASQVEVDAEGYYVVRVEYVAREHARHHLWQYEQEKRQRPAPDVPFVAQSGAWRGSIVYALVLLLVPMALAQGWLPRDPYMWAVVDPERMHAGEWWRAITALTLHWDGPHLLGNLGGGVLLGFTAAQVWGNARAWLLIVASAALANVVEAAPGVTQYVSAGASTAVFAALGLVAAHAWRTHGAARRGLRGWAPLIAGVAVLGLFGAGAPEPQVPVFLQEADSTNVLSHALGFASGALFGMGVATPRGERWLRAIPAPVAVVVVLAAVGLAWAGAMAGGVK